MKLPAKYFPLLLLFLLCSCGKKTVSFYVANVSQYNESLDIQLVIDGDVVSTKILKATKVADSYERIDVDVDEGYHLLVVKSPIHGLRDSIPLRLSGDTSLIVEYQHQDEVAYDVHGQSIGLKEGPEKFFLMAK